MTIFIVLLNFYKPFTPSYRNRRTVTSFLTSCVVNKSIKFSFFKKKIKNKHKFMPKSNRAYLLNMVKPIYCVSVITKLFKFSYSNTFGGFFETSEGSYFIKKLNYGFSLNSLFIEKSMYDNYFLNNLMFRSLQKWCIYFFFINTKFFIFQCKITKRFYATSAGTFCCIKNKELTKRIFFVKLPSKKSLFFDYLSTGFIGRNSNIFYKLSRFSSFSNKFNIKKKKQTTRGIAMNPVDHPNGGRSKIKQPFLNPWGRIAKKGK